MWNAVTAASDTIFHLGDFAWDRAPIEDVAKIFKRLRGKKVLLAGNHDHPEIHKLPWDAVHLAPVHFLDPAVDVKVIAGHWPLREWDGWHSGAIHIHGHTHGNLPSSRRSIDVGVDAVGAHPDDDSRDPSAARGPAGIGFQGCGSGRVRQGWRSARGR